MISTNSDVEVIIVKDEENLKNYFKKNLIKNEIIIGMGAGTISNWIRNLKQSFVDFPSYEDCLVCYDYGSILSLFVCFDGDPQSQVSTHSSNNFSEELFSSQLRRQS